MSNTFVGQSVENMRAILESVGYLPSDTHIIRLTPHAFDCSIRDIYDKYTKSCPSDCPITLDDYFVKLFIGGRLSMNRTWMMAGGCRVFAL